jgi:hypothetical protein
MVTMVGYIEIKIGKLHAYFTTFLRTMDNLQNMVIILEVDLEESKGTRLVTRKEMHKYYTKLSST